MAKISGQHVLCLGISWIRHYHFKKSQIRIFEEEEYPSSINESKQNLRLLFQECQHAFIEGLRSFDIANMATFWEDFEIHIVMLFGILNC